MMQTPQGPDEPAAPGSPTCLHATAGLNAADGVPALPQQTLASEIRCSGIGLHSGKRAAIRLRPAPVGTGIVFRRTDLAGKPRVPATWQYARETPLCTTLGDGPVHIATVEHLMAALAGMSVDNALIDVEGNEIPIMDGSAAPFVFLIECAGIAAQNAARRGIRIRKAVSVAETARAAYIAPAAQGLQLDFEIDFPNPVVARQQREDTLETAAFKRDLARARTFGFLNDVDRLRASGLALGGSLNNAVVIDGERILNDGGLRYADEFVRHKVLDSIGDLYLAGGPIIGRFTGVRAGHALNIRLLRALFADPEAWSWVTPGAADLAAPAIDGAALLGRAVAHNA